MWVGQMMYKMSLRLVLDPCIAIAILYVDMLTGNSLTANNRFLSSIPSLKP